MAKLFTSRLLLTSNADLLSYLKQHPRLYNLIANGEYIMNYDKLDSLENNFVNTGKYAIIINTLHSSTPQSSISLPDKHPTPFLSNGIFLFWVRSIEILGFLN